MADSIQLTCWPSPDYLVIGIQVKNLAGQWHSNREELVPIDTGYNGQLLVPYSLFETLNLHCWCLPDSPPQKIIATTVTGQVIYLMEAYVEVVIPKTDEVYQIVAQTFIGNTRFLIGRGFLHRFRILFDGPARQTCLLTLES